MKLFFTIRIGLKLVQGDGNLIFFAEQLSSA